jgi:hypothetical protein
LYKEIATTSAFIHHLTIGSALALGLYSGGCCRPYHFFMLAEELSTIPLNVKAMYKHHERINTIASLLFALTFFLSRMIYGMYVYLYALSVLPDYLLLCADAKAWNLFTCALLQCAMCTISRVLNFYWFWLIAKKIRQSMSPSDSKKRKARVE